MITGGKRWRRYEISAIARAYRWSRFQATGYPDNTVVTAGPISKRQKHTFATLGVWSFLSDLAGRNEVLLYDGPEQSRRFARIAGRIPCMSAMMSWASAGTHRYLTAGS